MKRIAVIAVIFAALFLLASCGSGMSKDEMTETYRTLVEASYEVNEIYYGGGLPFRQNEAVMAQLAGVAEGTQGFKVSYMPVDEAARYQSEKEIRAAAAAVYSPSMCEHLYILGFEGLRDADSDTLVSFARYIEQDGVLTVRIDLAEEALPMGRTYDFDSMLVIADEKDRVRAEFQSYMNGAPSDKVKITLIRTEDGWRLDSPTY